jgi:hypothetical protein
MTLYLLQMSAWVVVDCCHYVFFFFVGYEKLWKLEEVHVTLICTEKFRV